MDAKEINDFFKSTEYEFAIEKKWEGQIDADQYFQILNAMKAQSKKENDLYFLRIDWHAFKDRTAIIKFQMRSSKEYEPTEKAKIELTKYPFISC